MGGGAVTTVHQAKYQVPVGERSTRAGSERAVPHWCQCPYHRRHHCTVHQISSSPLLSTISSSSPSISLLSSFPASRPPHTVIAVPLPLTMNGHGYGPTPRCSLLQEEWQTRHPLFNAVHSTSNVKATLCTKVGTISTMRSITIDPSVLLPSPVSALVVKGKPELIDYVQLPMYLWVPDHFYPDVVPYLPCPVEGCKEVTQRRRWHSGGPRLIHGVHHAVYLHCWEYECPSADHKGKTFSGWDHGSLAKLSPLVRSLFRFVLTAEEGVTLELHGRIVDARVGGASMNALMVRQRLDLPSHGPRAP